MRQENNEWFRKAKANTDEPEHNDHLPNMLLVFYVPPKQFRPAEAAESVLWFLAPKVLVVDPSSSVSYEVEPPV